MTLFLQQIVNGLVIGSTYAVVALGFGLIFTVLRVINFAHPEIFMLGMFSGLFAGVYSQSLIVSLCAGVAGASLAGLALERLVLRPLRTKTTLMTLIGTLGAGIVIQNAVAIAVGTDPRPFPLLISESHFGIGDVSVTTAQAIALLMGLLVLSVVSVYVRKTRAGRATRAIAENPTVAAAFGIDVGQISRLTVVLASGLAGAASVSVGILYGNAWAYIGLLYGLKSFICMLVAGNRHIEGIAFVALMLGVVEALVTGYISSSWRDVVAAALLIVTLMYFPAGIFGSYVGAGGRP